MNAMEEFYNKEFEEFNLMAEKQGIKIPKGIAANLDEETYKKLYNSTVIHVPLSNVEKILKILSYEKVKEIFKI